jgi:hypothetical protein
MKSLLIKSKLFGDLVIPADDFEESGDIWWGLCPYLDINVFGENNVYIQANIYPVKDGITCTDRELEVIESVELIDDLGS